MSKWLPLELTACRHVWLQFLAYDTQMLMGGRKHELSPEEYIYGAMQLYIDVVYLFLIILSLFGGSNN